MSSLRDTSVSLSLPSVRVARIMEARRVAEMVAALPEQVYAPGMTPLTQQACLEIFFVHVRSLIEFLEIRKGNPKKDFSVTDVAPDWFATISPTHGERLLRYWETDSQQVMHFSRHRVRQDDGTYPHIDVELDELTKIADDVLKVWDQYAVHIDHPLSPPRRGFNLFKSGSQNIAEYFLHGKRLARKPCAAHVRIRLIVSYSRE